MAPGGSRLVINYHLHPFCLEESAEMLLPLLSDQLAELLQAVGQAVVQPEHHPKLADPMPVGSGRHPITDTEG